MSSSTLKSRHIDKMATTTPAPKTGKMNEFWEVWTENQDFLLGLCRRWTKGDEAEAKEILSGTMMRALDKTGGNIRTINNPKAWLARVLHSYCVDQYRKRQRNVDLPLDLDILHLTNATSLHASGITPESDLIHKENYHRIMARVEALPERLKSVMILRVYQDMPFRDIAAHLQITPENARKRVQEAVRLMEDDRRSPDLEAPIRNRQADPQGFAPRSERKAAEETLRETSPERFRVAPFIKPVKVLLDLHRTVELPLAAHRYPIRIQQQLNTLDRYVQLHPTGWVKRQERAFLLALDGQLNTAIAELHEVLERQPQRLETRLILSRWLTWADRKTEALLVLEQGLTMAPNPAWRALLRSKSLRLQGAYQLAIQELRALEQMATFPTLPSLIAENYISLEEWYLAAQALEQNQILYGFYLQ